MSKSTNQSPLEVFLRSKAKELKSDFNDVPKWVIEASNEFIEKSKPSAKDKAIEAAGHYLCDSDEMTIEEQIEAIANHEDQSDMIDNVEGVIVWEKVEWSFTCDSFLDQIGW